MSHNTYQMANAALKTLQDFLPAYLNAIRIRHSLPEALPAPASFLAASDIESTTPQDQYPRVMVVCPGLSEDPISYPGGHYEGTYGIAAGVAVKGLPDRDKVNFVIGHYLEAIKECLIREGLSGVEADLKLTDERTDEGDPDMARTSGAGVVGIEAKVFLMIENDISLFPDGPPVDPTDPPPDSPVVDEVHIDVENRGLVEEL